MNIATVIYLLDVKSENECCVILTPACKSDKVSLLPDYSMQVSI